MSASQVDPHDKMRSRDVNRVARGEQAPRPAHAPGTVSPPPENVPKFAANNEADHGDQGKEEEEDKTRLCFTRYLEYHKCLQEKKKDANECKRFADYVHAHCPSELIKKWDQQRQRGTLPRSV